MMDLEGLRRVFEDPRSNSSLGKITKVSVAEDRSCVKVLVQLFPELREIVARMSWDSVGPDCGLYDLPSVNDLVIVEFPEKDVDQAVVTRRLSSKEDRVPLKAVEGHFVMKSKSGKQIWISSDNKIFLTTGDVEPTQPIPLGKELQTLLATMLEKLGELAQVVSTHTHTGNLGYPTGAPLQSPQISDVKTSADNLKADPVQNGKILSALSFTK